jgi:hypothetical protein
MFPAPKLNNFRPNTASAQDQKARINMNLHSVSEARKKQKKTAGMAPAAAPQ